MRYKIDHDLHIHSHLSICADGDMKQNKDAILAFAEEKGYKHICMTDHFWDKPIPNGGWDYFYGIQDLPHIKEALPLPQGKTTAFHFGCETDLAAGMVLGIRPETMKEMELIIIPTTHMHFAESGVKRDATVPERAQAWVERLDAVLDMDLPFHKVGIAHLACDLLLPSHETDKVFELISDEELERLFQKAAQRGCGIELNRGDFGFDKQTKERMEQTIRVFAMAKKCGCKFYLGSDAHHPHELQMSGKYFDIAVDCLGLTEDDKFRPFD